MRFYTNVTTSRNKILVREVDTDQPGQRINKRVDYQPSLYTLSRTGEQRYHSIYGDPLHRHHFDGLSQFYRFRKDYEHVENMDMYGDMHPSVQFLSDAYPDNLEFDFSLIRIFYLDIEVFTHDGKFPQPDTAKYPVSAISIYDSDTDTWYQWGLEYEGCFKGAETYDPVLRHAGKKIAYAGFDTEQEMLNHFLKFWHKFCPDIVTGWNSEQFDIPYLINRMQNHYPNTLDPRKLSPWNKIFERTANDPWGNHYQYYQIEGVSHLDYLVQYKKHSYTPQEQYTLDYVAHSEELPVGKLTYEEVEGLHELYQVDYQKYLDYNIRDTEIVKLLEDKRGIMFMVVASAYRSKCNYEDIISPVRTWDSLIYNYLKKKDVFMPPRKAKSKSDQYHGAFVKSPQVGWFDWVVSVDLASLYPSLIRQVNISPETLMSTELHGSIELDALCNKVTVPALVNKELNTALLKQHDLSLGANGTLYRRDEQGFLPVLLESLYKERKNEKGKMIDHAKEIERIDSEIKDNPANIESLQRERAQHKKNKDMFHTLQYSKKILLNSAYGALGNQFSRLYDIRLAEAVTISGQTAIQWIERKLNEYFNEMMGTERVDYVIYIDTDGMYLNMGPVVEKMMPNLNTDQIVDALDKFFNEYVSKFISDSYEEFCDYMNNREQLMFMDRECIADVGIWSTKKRYLLNVYDNEGVRYAKPKLKVMGYNFIKTSIPERCRKWIYDKKGGDDILSFIVRGDKDGMYDRIADIRSHWNELTPDQIARPTSVNGIVKYSDPQTIYAKGTMAHIRACILYNHWIKKMNLPYPDITDGNKVRYVSLTTPNPIGDNVMGFPTYMPKEFGLDKYVDYDIAFEKMFLKPLQEVTEAIGWTVEKVASLDGVFARQLGLDNAA